MRIKVEKIIGDTVYYSSEFGNGKLKWNGGIPQTGKECFVEFELDDKFSYQSNLFISNEKKYSISSEGDEQIFSGLFESLDSDGCAVLRMGNYITLFEITGDYPPVGTFIVLKTSRVTAYPHL